MKRTRHKRVPSPRRRALEFIAAHPDGCTEALLAAENIPADMLVQSGLVIARNERLEDEDGAVETTRVWITEAGERLLAVRRVGADGQVWRTSGSGLRTKRIENRCAINRSICVPFSFATPTDLAKSAEVLCTKIV